MSNVEHLLVGNVCLVHRSIAFKDGLKINGQRGRTRWTVLHSPLKFMLGILRVRPWIQHNITLPRVHLQLLDSLRRRPGREGALPIAS